MFPLPKFYPGTEAAAGDVLPSHVHKRSRNTRNCSGDCSGDVMQLGTWVDGAPDQTGTWSPTPGVPHELAVIDQGNRYASKDLDDVPNGRRINFVR